MEAMASVLVEAPTVMVLGALAGDMVQLSPPLLLPAAGMTDKSVNKSSDQSLTSWHHANDHGRLSRRCSNAPGKPGLFA
jgi:hypothetical protein